MRCRLYMGNCLETGTGLERESGGILDVWAGKNIQYSRLIGMHHEHWPRLVFVIEIKIPRCRMDRTTMFDHHHDSISCRYHPRLSSGTGRVTFPFGMMSLCGHPCPLARRWILLGGSCGMTRTGAYGLHPCIHNISCSGTQCGAIADDQVSGSVLTGPEWVLSWGRAWPLRTSQTMSIAVASPTPCFRVICSFSSQDQPSATAGIR